MPSQTISIAASADDQQAGKVGSSYPPGGVVEHNSGFTTDRSFYSGPQYQCFNGLLKFNTSVLPDSARIDSAVLRMYLMEKGNTNSLSVTGGWYEWTGASTDYTLTPETNAFTSRTIAGLTLSADNDFTITDSSGFPHISKTGYTFLRTHISQRASDAAPTGANYVQFASFEDANTEARLIVTYTEGPTPDFTYTTSPGQAVFTDTSTPASGTTITSWAWTFDDGGTSTLQNPTHTYASGGTFSVTLTVTASNGISWFITKDVTVPPPAVNQPPVAFFTASTAGLDATFTDGSTDTDGTIVSRSWDFGDAASSTTTNPSHTYAASGTYTVTLTVTDDDGATDSYSRVLRMAVAGTAKSYVAGPIFLRESTLTEDIDSTQTTIPVAELDYWPPNSAQWPPNNEGMLGPEGAAEKITWTAKSATHGPGNLTGVTRGAFGTTPASHTSGEVIGLYGRHDAGLKIKYKMPLFPVNASLTLQELRRHFDSQRFAWADFSNLNESTELEIISPPISSGSISVTLDEAGIATTRSTSVTATREVVTLTINNAQTTSGFVTVTLDGVTYRVSLPTTNQVSQVVITRGDYTGYGGRDEIKFYDAAGAFITTPVNIEPGASPENIAAKVRSMSFSGWTNSGSGSTITFTATTPGHRGNLTKSGGPGRISPYYKGIFYDSDTMVEAETTLLQDGQNLLSAAEVAAYLRTRVFEGWQVSGSGANVVFTALEPGDKTGTHSYSAGATGATSTSGMVTTTPGAQTSISQVATALRSLLAASANWNIGGGGAFVTMDANSSGAKQDATFSPGATGTVGNIQTIHQGSKDIVGYLTDSGGVEQTRRLLGNFATTTEFNLETSVSGSGTEHGIISFWGSFGTDPLILLWRVEALDLTEFPVGEAAYGVTSESSSGLTWEVRSDEVELTDRGKTYYRDHNLRGQLLGQLHYFGILEPEQARDDIGVQELWHPVMPGQQISLAFYMRYENMPVAFPSQPLFISFHHIDGTVTPVGDASGLLGLSGDAAWAEYTTPTFSAPTLDENPVPAYWMRIQSKQMSAGTLVVQEFNPSLGTVATRTPYYAFEGTFRAQFDARTPKETPYLLLERARTDLEVQFEENGGVVTPQYRSAADPASFEGTWYTDASEVPDLPVIDVDVALSGDGLSTPEVPTGYPRTEYRARPSKRHLFLKSDRTEFAGGVIMDKVADWYRKPGTSQVLLPSGHTLKQKLNEPVGYLPSFELWVFRPETVKYLLENLNAVGMLFYAEVFNELLLLKVLTPEPKFTRATLSRFDNEDLGDTSAVSRYSFWVSDELSAEVMDVTEISE